MTTERRTRPLARDRDLDRDHDRDRDYYRDRDYDHRATVLAALLLAASAATLAYVLLGGHHGPVELPADVSSNAARS
ncbi:hypothetical protein [Streptomyces sp. NPDC054765]